jgi:hypothetical protein
VDRAVVAQRARQRRQVGDHPQTQGYRKRQTVGTLNGMGSS